MKADDLVHNGKADTGATGLLVCLEELLFYAFKVYGGYAYTGVLDDNADTAAAAYGNFTVPAPYAHIKEICTKIIGAGCKMGEGWLLTAEMMELIESGYGNIVCAQPFGCLPNHIVGKGASRAVKALYPDANIVAIDYDPSATKVNQENRIKLMLAAAREKERERASK